MKMVALVCSVCVCVCVCAVNNGDYNGVLLTIALHSACGSGAHNCVSVLLSNDAHPNVVDNWQQTGLFAAAEGGHAECILKVITSY